MKNILLIILLILIILFSPKIKEGLVFPMFCGKNQYSDKGKCKAIDDEACTPTDTTAEDLYTYFSDKTTGICTFNKIVGSSDNIVSLKVGETYVPECEEGLKPSGRYYCHQTNNGPVKKGEASCTKVSDFKLPLNWYEAVEEITFKYTNTRQKKSLKYTCIPNALSSGGGELLAENISDDTIIGAKCKCDTEYILESGQCRKVELKTDTPCQYDIENAETCKKAALKLGKWTTNNFGSKFGLPHISADDDHPRYCSSNPTTGVHFNLLSSGPTVNDEIGKKRYANDKSICFTSERT
jgi:hypothetical protein